MSDSVNCWNREGVGGDRSCERLREHIHCRNCDAWAEGSSRVMQRPLPKDYRREWAAHYARAEQERADTPLAALVFRIGGEWFALPAELALTVAELAPVHRIPHRSGQVLRGLVNIRGQLYPCFSLAGLFGIDAGAPATAAHRHAYARLLAVRLQQQDCALPVDEVYGIHRHAARDLHVPAGGGRELLRHVHAILHVENRIVGCLDPDLLGRQLAGLMR
ncbi:chemotaxis protein CheW [Noviherbaspirillum aridicola]|uniref:Chemotaxis protein CheW n=1 Tax=Noviherbaspirillum aridicola TaxID=2849687 RepID=A0ABQ4Q490_9BURK|nr:chemotaxis protein CheW [Noviherbaspirillum aridicola]GIZ52005.1 chew domain protein [Noviherbaspirillum aridicola]